MKSITILTKSDILDILKQNIAGIFIPLNIADLNKIDNIPNIHLKKFNLHKLNLHS